ncbi:MULTISPECIES: fumarylacetoacetate hydrolase family protein [Sutcliffiella]|uniref:Fumarylacetoacetase-like C-terminal domain-containing protein n=1 Tax=Sutcliffiella cohnii TaxID=33932 RepID=A0A223KM62_9BACI|nr:MULTISPECIES: fumarylacetoacetate hydrolase family protein [Sutcliffiella]AST90552.1 hypothetical protein BC6307_04295 [Sutcliffiella cohnii]MED4016835.1 fumarylacetoacetate hydrolase family protein [Sutcliffiella cohnii]WBL16202.1 fumarylacetoacetate hydrolase family protein [Sutcliffiella sp. NC1]
MRFLTGVYENSTFVGVVPPFNTNVCINLNEADEKMNGQLTMPNDLHSCIQLGEQFIEKVKEIQNWVQISVENNKYVYPLSEVRILAPITRPTKNILCVGKNYREHAIEMGSVEDIPKHIMMFTKAPTTVIGHLDFIDRHSNVTEQLDYEGELAVIIGKKGKEIKEEEAYDYVFGYTILNDITARDLQSKHKQFFLGKSLDTSCPMGPVIVAKEAIPNPEQLSIETRVNGEVRQKSNTDQMIFTIPNIIATISKGMTLEPGDIIATGTPAGVGKGFKPPRFLQTGDVIEVKIEQIGSLVNEVK